MPARSREETLAQLRQALASGVGEARENRRVIGTGAEPLDRLLPWGGLLAGTLVEWLSADLGSGARTLALGAALAACRQGGLCVVCEDAYHWNPEAAWTSLPGLAQRLVVLRPRTHADRVWAVEQALRSRAVAAVWVPCARLPARDFRRWQLAAEASTALGLLLRPASARREPSWAEVRLLVELRLGVAAGRRLRVEVLRCRGGSAGRSVDLILEDQTGQMRGVRDLDETLPVLENAAVADPTPRRRQART